MNEVWLAVIALVGTLGTATLTLVGAWFKLKFDAQLIAERSERELLAARLNDMEAACSNERLKSAEIIKRLTEERDELHKKIEQMETKLKWL